MTRTVPEWIGKTDDSSIPPRVRVRVFDRQGGRCAECDRKLGVAGEPFDVDHITALVNGGENRESNLRALCRPCHRGKTAADVAQKAKDNRVKAKHLGQKKTAFPLPGGRKSPWKRKIGGNAERRE